MTHICVSKLNIFGSNNGLSPGWRQTIIIQEHLFENVVWTMEAILFRPHCVNSLCTNNAHMTSWIFVKIVLTDADFFVHLEISPHTECRSSRPHYRKQGKVSSSGGSIIFQQIYNVHILYKQNTCNIIRRWLSVRCKANLAENQSNAKSQAFCHFSSPALYVQERTSLAVK